MVMRRRFVSFSSSIPYCLTSVKSKIFKDIQRLDQQNLTCRLCKCLYGSQFSYKRWQTSTSVLYHKLHARNFMYIEPGRLVYRPLYRIPLVLHENHCLWDSCEKGMHIFTCLGFFKLNNKNELSPFSRGE